MNQLTIWDHLEEAPPAEALNLFYVEGYGVHGRRVVYANLRLSEITAAQSFLTTREELPWLLEQQEPVRTARACHGWRCRIRRQTRRFRYDPETRTFADATDPGAFA